MITKESARDATTAVLKVMTVCVSIAGYYCSVSQTGIRPSAEAHRVKHTPSQNWGDQVGVPR